MPVFHGFAPCEMVFTSIILKTPQTFSSLHTALKAAASGPDKVHIIDGDMDIERPWILYSGKRIRSVEGYARFVWRTSEQICSVASARCWGVETWKSWDCTAAMVMPPEVLLSPPKPLILAVHFSTRTQNVGIVCIRVEMEVVRQAYTPLSIVCLSQVR